MSTNTESRTVTLDEAVPIINTCFKRKRPLFLWGPPGVGKSDIIEQIADSKKGLMIDLRLSQMDPTDIRGIPYFDKESGLMKWAPPIELPSEELASQYPVVILFLDEMNSAAPTVQAAAYQLILNRRIGTYHLPDNVVIVAAGNREGDKGVTYRMPSPLANRFVHLEVRVDFDSWFDWATNNRVHQDVVGYLAANKQDLFDFKPNANTRSFATPRTWFFVSELLDEHLPKTALTDLVSGTIGEGTALKFMAHREVSGQLPAPIDVLQGRADGSFITKDKIAVMHSLSTSLCYELREQLDKLGEDSDDWHKMMDNFIAFAMEHFVTEVVVFAVRVALKNFKLPVTPSRMPSWGEFHNRYGKIITAATKG